MATGKITVMQLEDLKEKKGEILKQFLEGEPPQVSGEILLGLWSELYDEEMQNIVVKTVSGPSDDETNPVMPYEKLQAVIHDGVGQWKWPRMYQRFDEIERRGEAYRPEEALNFGQANKNPGIVAQKVLVVGGGPIGLRCAIELVMGGHLVTLIEKRVEVRDEEGKLLSLGFTNRINRPRMWPFVKNDLAKLNGKDLMSRQAAFPVFTEPDTSSIGIDELQLLLLKNALLVGVDIRLGVGYTDSTINVDEETCKPTWNCSLSYDAKAAAKYNMTQGVNLEEFDCLIGCDGPRSTVREKQAKFFGNVEKRKFMDCVGIVSNIQKVPRKRLKELGFADGLEPGDISSTKNFNQELFQKIEEEADADIEKLIFYKASFHNYTILVPKRADMIKHGLSGKVYSFHEGRNGKAAQEEEKMKLRRYARNVLKAAGIPVDDDAENGGFVGVPNDCMAFDFAECWNTKRSFNFNLPPPNYSVEEDGEWEGRKLVPYIGLAGDSLLEPFWPMGLGLKRGWQALLDVNYVVDNLYNSALYMETLGKEADDMTWEDHFEQLNERAEKNFEMCNRLQICENLGLGEWEDNSEVMKQLKKKLKDPEKPPLYVEIDPWTRYAPLADDLAAKIRKMPKEEKMHWVHPAVEKAVQVASFYSNLPKSETFPYPGKELISVNGRVAVARGGNTNAAGGKKKAIGAGKAPASRRGKKA